VRRGLIVALLVLAAVPLACDSADSDSESAAVASGWHWTKHNPSAPLSRTEVTGAALGHDIYVIGGFVPPNRTSALVERLHRGKWTRVRPLPVGLNHAAAVGYRGYVYVIGGYASPDGLTQPVGTLLRYDPKRNRWKRLPGMPTARAALAVGAAGGKLFAAGGSDGTRPMATFEIYDITKRRWSRGPALSVPREHLGGAVARGRFYAVAGRNSDGNLRVFERYDPGRHAWTRLPDVPKERGGNGAAGIAGSIVAVGGEEGAGTIAEVDLFDIPGG
jgi:N-acetylneuraminic acid mutarotase